MDIVQQVQRVTVYALVSCAAGLPGLDGVFDGFHVDFHDKNPPIVIFELAHNRRTCYNGGGFLWLGRLFFLVLQVVPCNKLQLATSVFPRLSGEGLVGVNNEGIRFPPGLQPPC